MEKYIQVFINNDVLDISPFSSVYSLKDKIKKIKKYINIPFENINLHYQGKLLSDKKSLFFYNIEENSNIDLILTVKGGDSSHLQLYLIYFLVVILYLTFIISGLPPILANSFFYIFKNTLLSIFTKIPEWIINISSFIFLNISLIFFIWSSSAYIIFPWLYTNNYDYCNSGLAAMNIGFWIMFSYMIIYGPFNSVDFFCDKAEAIVNSESIPKILKPTITMMEYTKNVWDNLKITPLYAIPVVGLIFFRIHNAMASNISYIYYILNIIDKFNCKDKDTVKTLSDVFNNINNIITLNVKVPSNIQDILLDASIIQVTKKYKSEFLVKLLKYGFSDLNLEQLNKELEKGEPGWEINSINRFIARSIVSFFCDFLIFSDNLKILLNEVGSENSIINMIKTGQIAGLISAIFLIIMFNYTYVFGSFWGYRYGT